MPKRFGFKRTARSALMGAGAVLGALPAGRAADPALRDALALYQDQVAIAGDFQSAMAALESDIAPKSEESPNSDKP